MKRWMLCLLGLFLVMGPVGCGRSGQDVRYFSYLDAPSEAVLTGSINGLCFSAVLESQGRTPADDIAISSMPCAKLTFTAPDSLKDICICYADGAWTASLGEVQGETDAEGFGQIAALLLCEQVVQSTQKQEDGLILSLSDGAQLTLDVRTKTPLRAEKSEGGRHVEIVVVAWSTSDAPK